MIKTRENARYLRLFIFQYKKVSARTINISFYIDYAYFKKKTKREKNVIKLAFFRFFFRKYRYFSKDAIVNNTKKKKNVWGKNSQV